MSDALDPRHGPYRGRQSPDLDEWCEEFVMNLVKKGYLRGGSATVRTLQEAQRFARTVARAAQDGHFREKS